MNANLVEACGKKKVAGAAGVKGMSREEILQFIQARGNNNVHENLKRLQKKDRASLCRLLKTFSNGKRILGMNAPRAPGAPGPRAPGPRARVSNSNSGSNSGRNRGNNAVNNANNSQGEVNYAKLENMFGNARIQYSRPSRRKEKDPLSGKMRLSARLEGSTKAKLRAMAKKGKLPEFKTREQLLKYVFTSEPKKVKRVPRKSRPTKKVSMLKIPKTAGNNATARKPTRPAKRVLSELTHPTVGKAFMKRIKELAPNKAFFNRMVKAEEARLDLENSPTMPMPPISMLPPAKTARNVVRAAKAKKKANKTYKLKAGERVATTLVRKARAERERKKGVSGLNAKKGRMSASNSNSNSNSNTSTDPNMSAYKPNFGKANSGNEANKVLNEVLASVEKKASTGVTKTRSNNISPTLLAKIMKDLDVLRPVNYGSRGARSSIVKGASKTSVRNLMRGTKK